MSLRAQPPPPVPPMDPQHSDSHEESEGESDVEIENNYDEEVERYIKATMRYDDSEIESGRRGGVGGRQRHNRRREKR